MQAPQSQREKRWKVVKDVDDEYSDIEWEDVVVGVEREAVKQTVVVVVRETQWEESQTKAKPSQENQPTHERGEHLRRKDETRQR
jgi:hypothetical protein